MPSKECQVMWEGKSDDGQVIDSEIGQDNDKIFCGSIFVIAIFPTGPPDY